MQAVQLSPSLAKIAYIVVRGSGSETSVPRLGTVINQGLFKSNRVWTWSGLLGSLVYIRYNVTTDFDQSSLLNAIDNDITIYQPLVPTHSSLRFSHTMHPLVVPRQHR